MAYEGIKSLEILEICRACGNFIRCGTLCPKCVTLREKRAAEVAANWKEMQKMNPEVRWGIGANPNQQPLVSDKAALEPATPDMVNHPPHYKAEGLGFEVIDVIEGFNLNFHLAQVIKYVLRYGRKNLRPDQPFEDLNKALWYLSRYVKILEKTRPGKESA